RASEGWGGLYRGLGPNVAAKANSWGVYFLSCVSFLCPFPPKRVRDLLFFHNTPHSRPLPHTILVRQGVVTAILANRI
ncbi:hypothetical protein BJY52DRAFT_1131959, partial [Lactarius psammicola]